jgi:hypothetical protein
VAEWSKASVYGGSIAGIMGSNSTASMDVCRDCCVLLGTGLCDGPITRPGGILPIVVCQWVWSSATVKLHNR